MRAPTDPPRAIDRLRDGAGGARVPDGFGRIVAMSPFGGRLHLIAEHGVSSAVFADDIDPDRQNIEIPLVVQREELAYGSDAAFVRRTLCTAVELMNDAHLPEGFDRETVLQVALAMAQDLAAVTDTVVELRQHEAAIRARLERNEIQRDQLPRTPNLKGRVDQAIVHLRNVQLGTVRIAELFYPKVRPNLPWDRALLGSVRRALPPDDPFLEPLDDIVLFLRRLANYRNAVTHPDDTKAARIFDYDLRASGAILAPTIEIIHPDAPEQRQDVVQFLDILANGASEAFELVVAVFCDRNARQFNDMIETRVIELPEGADGRGTRFVWRSTFRNGVPPRDGPPA